MLFCVVYIYVCVCVRKYVAQFCDCDNLKRLNCLNPFSDPIFNVVVLCCSNKCFLDYQL